MALSSTNGGTSVARTNTSSNGTEYTPWHTVTSFGWTMLKQFVQIIIKTSSVQYHCNHFDLECQLPGPHPLKCHFNEYINMGIHSVQNFVNFLAMTLILTSYVTIRHMMPHPQKLYKNISAIRIA